MHPSIFRLARSPLVRLALLGLIVAELGVVLWVYSTERSRLHLAEKVITYGTPRDTKEFWRLEMPGLPKPPVQPASASRIADHEEVIGVMVDGKARAYWLRALSFPPWHIINDVVGDVPISVTYCDRTECVRVFSGRRSSAPLEIDLAGMYDREMVVKVGDVRYLQQSGKPLEAGEGVPSIPLADHPWERTTWKEWRRKHPESEVFIGVGTRGPKP